MPGINGLELIEKARAVCPELIIMILSGYEEIEYYQKAIQEGVFAYILKPLDLNEFLKTMDKAKAALLENKNTLKIKRMALLNSILVSDKFDVDTIKQGFYKYEIPLSSEGYIAIVIHPDNQILVYNELNPDELATLLENIIILADRMFQERNGIFFRCNRGKITGIINCSSARDESENVAAACKELVDMVSSQLFCWISVGIGEYCEHPTGLKKSYETALDACKLKLYTGHQSVNLYDPLKNFCETSIDINLERKQIYESLEILDFESFKAGLNNIFAIIAENKPKFTEIEKICYQVFTILEEALTKLGSEKDSLEISSEFSAETVKTLETLEDIRQWVMNLAEKIMKTYSEHAGSSSSKAVRTALSFIHSNYHKSISLNDVAQKVYMHPVYFSQLFKGEVGVSFTEYLNHLRMEKAKDHLKNLKYKVRDIAQMLGYTDEKHFYKVFKKSVGMTPNEYRNKILN